MPGETGLDFDKKACSSSWAHGVQSFDQEERFTLALGEFIILIVSLHQRLLEFPPLRQFITCELFVTSL